MCVSQCKCKPSRTPKHAGGNQGEALHGGQGPVAWGDLLMPFAEAGGKSWIKYGTWDKLEEAQLEQPKMQKMWPIVHAIEQTLEEHNYILDKSVGEKAMGIIYDKLGKGWG